MLYLTMRDPRVVEPRNLLQVEYEKPGCVPGECIYYQIGIPDRACLGLPLVSPNTDEGAEVLSKHNKCINTFGCLDFNNITIIKPR